MKPWEKNSKDPLFNDYYTTKETCEIIFSEMIEIINEQSNNKKLKVCCPCDGEQSEIPKYLREHSNWEIDYFGDLDVNSEEARERMLKADVIITNPPFVMRVWRPFVTWLIENKKNFFVFGPLLSYNKLLKFVTENAMFFSPKNHRSHQYYYNRPDGTKRVAITQYYTTYNVPIYEYKYKPAKEKQYYNDTVVYDKLNHIPPDYMDWMYVPVTSLRYLQPFEIDETKLNVPGKYVRIYLRRKA